MDRTITFVTTNAGKFEEVSHWLKRLEPSIKLEQATLAIPEIQSLDIYEVALDKAHRAWSALKKPLIIEDGGVYFERYNQFPGTLSRYVFEGIGFDGLWMLAKDDPRAYFLGLLVYIDSAHGPHCFEGMCKGTIVELRPEIKSHPDLPFTKIFVPEGATKTFAELRGTEEEKKYHHRLQAMQQFVAWLKEYR